MELSLRVFSLEWIVRFRSVLELAGAAFHTSPRRVELVSPLNAAAERWQDLARRRGLTEELLSRIPVRDALSSEGKSPAVNEPARDPQQLLTDQVWVLAENDRTVEAFQDMLAAWRAGRVRQQLALMEIAWLMQVVEQRYDIELNLDDGQLEKLHAIDNAVQSLGESQQMAVATKELQQALSDQTRALDDIRKARHTLAMSRRVAGEPVAPASALQQLTVRHSLAVWRAAAGDLQGAANDLQQVLSDQLRILGPNHRDILEARHTLAVWRGEAGDPAAAVAALQELLSDQLRILGPNHPDTQTVQDSLNIWHLWLVAPFRGQRQLASLSVDVRLEAAEGRTDARTVLSFESFAATHWLLLNAQAFGYSQDHSIANETTLGVLKWLWRHWDDIDNPLSDAQDLITGLGRRSGPAEPPSRREMSVLRNRVTSEGASSDDDPTK